ncbi:MAG: hypothetical protein A3H51_00860 [Candidatus Spechtbacteria bacterium RIFCSPLOWO2_02_FULL_38_8]|uniref:Large ribosomal subunit protein bL25 n=1 Tax=Candidatus Spechtbacteria bacterium RIFCSPLOWO2_02_FULL_38_8 TaxID=1802164 RepID=A0A1G2HFL8_9BACT|nr:MAG: hypothetical protein A3H51_00860 [Candidatus Spechtbacteria bacterium RIFCSPLOWO2_02_FULL_38_8]
MLHLSVKTRDTNITKAKDLLLQGVIPGIIYGPKDNPKTVAVDYKKFSDIYKTAGETTLVALDIDKAQGKPDAELSGTSPEDTQKETDLEKAKNVVLIRDIQRHPVSGNFMHVDFYKLPLDQEITISVPVELEGEAPAVKEQGGILVHNLHEIEIKALPVNLIHEIIVNLNSLVNIGDSILVKDINIPNNVEILADGEEMVCTVEAPREEEAEEAETLEGDAIESIKTEGEEKRAEKEAEKIEEAETGGGE